MEIGYQRPTSLEEALAALDAAGPEARPLAGGQSLVPLMNLGLALPDVLVDISRIAELREVTEQGGELVVGAGVTHHRVASDPVIATAAPLLAAAAAHIGSRRIRNVGTLGGSLCHGDPAAELPLACAALDATYDVVTGSGSVVHSATEFPQGYYTTALEPGSILAAVRIPGHSGRGWGFQEYSRRAGDFALAAAAATLRLEQGRIADPRVWVNGAADRPTRLDVLERRLAGLRPQELSTALAGCVDQLEPTEDPYVPPDYRRRLIGTLAGRAVADAVATAEEAR